MFWSFLLRMKIFLQMNISVYLYKFLSKSGYYRSIQTLKHA